MFTVRLVALSVAAILTASATALIATVTAPGPIRISGAQIPATAAASVPVGIGDVISSTNSAAVIRFGERGFVTLNQRSSVRISNDGDQTLVCLVEGSYHYKFVPNSKLTVCKNDKPVATRLEGNVSTGTNLKIPLIVATLRPTVLEDRWTRLPQIPRPAGVVSAGGGAGLIAGVAAAKSKHCPDDHGDGHDCRVDK